MPLPVPPTSKRRPVVSSPGRAVGVQPCLVLCVTILLHCPFGGSHYLARLRVNGHVHRNFHVRVAPAVQHVLSCADTQGHDESFLGDGSAVSMVCFASLNESMFRWTLGFRVLSHCRPQPYPWPLAFISRPEDSSIMAGDAIAHFPLLVHHRYRCSFLIIIVAFCKSSWA